MNDKSLLLRTLAALALFCATAGAATRTVTSLEDDGPGSLRDTIAATDQLDTITFAVAGTIELQHALYIDKPLTIEGPGAGSLALRGHSLSISESFFVKISGLTMKKSDSESAVYNHGNLTLTDCIFDQNSNGYGGPGAIYNDGSLAAINCTFAGNVSDTYVSCDVFGFCSSDGGGGAISNDGGAVALTSCTFSANSAPHSSNPEQFPFPGLGGGALLNKNGGRAVVTSCKFEFNTAGADAGGGAISNRSYSTLAVSACTFAGNQAGQGGGIYDSGRNTTVSVSQCTFSNNSSAIHNGYDFYDAMTSAGSISVSACTFSQNSRGAIHNDSGGAVTATNSTFIGNGIPDKPAINNVSAYVALVNCTVFGNAGGIYTEGPGYLTIFNTISAGNNGADFTNNGTPVAERNNLIGGDPKLGPLQDNGGLTQTRALLPGSPAIDAGDDGVQNAPYSLTADQRGHSRQVGSHVDIGAFEYDFAQVGPDFVVTTVDEHDDLACDAGDCTLLEALNVANANADASVITFLPGVTGTIKTQLTLSGLKVSNPVTIEGPGARLLSVTGSNIGRVFRVISPNVNISGLTITNGKVSGENGGAILNDQGGLTLTDCAIVQSVALLNNSFAGGSGGGIYSSSGATLALSRCTINGHRAGLFGGGVYNEGTFAATNCTFSDNMAESGGGILSRTANGASTSVLRNCTITRCTAAGVFGGSVSGGYYGDGDAAQHRLGNTIVAGNFGPTNPDICGPITSDGHNFIGKLGNTTGFTDGAKGDQIGTVAAPKDPKLDISLGNYGGPTDTHPLLGDSTAINAGDDALAEATDQRGYFRAGSSDMGAFEANGIANGTPPLVTTSGATDIGITTATLHAAVNANGLPTTFQFTSDFGSFVMEDAGNGTALVPFNLTVNGLTPNTQYHFNAVATNSAGTTEATEQTFTTLPAPQPAALGNISTRLRVETGDNILIAGFIITGAQPKNVIIRGIGASLPFDDRLANPTLELRDSMGALIDANDNWVDSPNKQAIIDTTIPPTNDLEPAIVATLPANNASYTAIVRGANDGTGIGVVEAYDLDRLVDSKLANISTRGFVSTGDNVLFAGTIVVGETPQNVLVRAIAPSLDVPAKMADPTLELRSANGDLIEANDNWADSPNKQAIIDTTIPPTNDLESAIVATLPANNAAYTAIVRGAGNTTGIAVVEVYALN